MTLTGRPVSAFLTGLSLKTLSALILNEKVVKI
jgi:hypothetical protein